MLNPQLVANFIQTLLSSATTDYKFNINAELNQAKGGYITGILRTVEAPQSPIENYTDVKYVYDCELLIPAARTNDIYIKIKDIVSPVLEANNGVKQDFGTGKGTITFSDAVPGKYDIAYGVGDSLPMRFRVFVTYTEIDTVTSADKKWYLDGVLIPYLSESVTIQTEGYTRKIFTEQYSKTLKTGQTRFYTFEVPETSEIGQNINALILNNNISATHTLKLIDGVTYTESNPFQTNVIVYTSGTVKSVKPNASSITITFTDTGVNTEYPMYQLGLVDFPFDRQGEDTRYFSTTAEQTAYFSTLLAVGAPFEVIPAPNLNSINISRQVYPNNTNKDLLFLTAKNYAVIKIMTTAQSTPQYLYFFITNCEVGEGGQVMYDLELDTVQTYFFDPNIKFADCLIERAHLNRFEKVDDTTVKFVTDPASKIYNAEDALNFPKRLTKRTKIGLPTTGIIEVDEWLDTNIKYWVYVFLATNKYNFKYMTSISPATYEYPSDIKSVYISSANSDSKFVDLGVACYCYPVFKENLFPVKRLMFRKKIKDQNGSILAESLISFQSQDKFITSDFETLNDGVTGKYYIKKVSTISPLYNISFTSYKITTKESGKIETLELYADDTINQTSVVENSQYQIDFKSITIQPTGVESLFINGFNFGDGASGLVFINYSFITALTSFKYNLPYNNNISILDIKNGTNRLSYNPKLNSQNFKELLITSSSGDEFAYDIQKLQSNQIQFLYNEPLQPEITKYYMRVSPVGLYVDGSDKNYTGLVGSNDTSLALVVNSYDQFLANNKNFWMQSNMKIVSGAAKSIVGFGASAISGKVNPAQGIMTGIDLATSIIDRNMTIDNMKNAPEQIKNANGNIIFNMSVTDIGLYVEEWSALDGDIQTGFDFMELYGFAVNAIDNIKDYVNIRKYHNYVKAQIQAVTGGSMSNISRENLRQRFAQGIRFWNVDVPDYSKENYENWLDN